MKLQVTQENLQKALAIVSRVADPRGALPVLANILITTEGNQIKLAATNLEIAISRTVNGKVLTPGKTTVPAKLTHDFVASLPSGTIKLETDGHKLHIQSGTYKSVINGTEAEEFPEIPSVQSNEVSTVEAHTLKQALSQTVFAASNDEARPVLTGILMQKEGDKTVFASTDSYRLAEKTVDKLTIPQTALLPATAAQDILRIISDDNAPIEVSTEEAQAQFVIGETELVTRLIDGSFPEYKRLLPSESETTLTLDRNELIGVTKTASLFARESAGSITLEVSEEEQNLSIASVASQVGENNAVIAAEVSGSGNITLNSRFLLDGLNAFKGEKITLAFSGKIKPCLLTAPGEEDYLHVVMPLKT